MAQQGYSRTETCRGRPSRGQRFREELKKGRRRQESDMISDCTERGIVLALACLVYKHYINLFSFALQETFFPVEGGQERTWHKGEEESKQMMKERWMVKEWDGKKKRKQIEKNVAKRYYNFLKTTHKSKAVITIILLRACSRAGKYIYFLTLYIMIFTNETWGKKTEFLWICWYMNANAA